MCNMHYSFVFIFILLVPPMVFINGQESVISVLHFSLILSFTIKNASPPVVYEDIRWRFKNSSGIFETITSDSNPRFQFSTDLLTLTITDVGFSDEGEYKLTVHNAAGIDEETITVDVEGKLQCIIYMYKLKLPPMYMYYCLFLIFNSALHISSLYLQLLYPSIPLSTTPPTLFSFLCFNSTHHISLSLSTLLFLYPFVCNSTRPLHFPYFVFSSTHHISLSC